MNSEEGHGITAWANTESQRPSYPTLSLTSNQKKSERKRSSNVLLSFSGEIWQELGLRTPRIQRSLQEAGTGTSTGRGGAAGYVARMAGLSLRLSLFATTNLQLNQQLTTESMERWTWINLTYKLSSELKNMESDE